MGTIVKRKRNDGTPVYMARVRIKRDNKIAYAETETFTRKQAAEAWIAARETDLRKPGALERAKADDNDPPLRDVIQRYVEESSGKYMGQTKASVLRTIQSMDICDKRCSTITSADLVAFVRSIDAAPSTRQNYLGTLSAVFAIARPAWGYPLDRRTVQDAFIVTRRLGTTGKAKSRDRRPTLAELDQLMDYFGLIKTRRPDSLPMQRIIPFAIFSTRRQEEIVSIRWADYEAAHNNHPARVLVRDMKSPGDKIGNHVWCDLMREAAAIIESMPRTDERIFPFTTDAVSAAFTRACKALLIPDLRFHDLRHEGVSRLFELGRTIPQAAQVSGHRSWHNLKRYAHIRETGDKYSNWRWRDAVAL
jgi:integrase